MVVYLKPCRLLQDALQEKEDTGAEQWGPGAAWIFVAEVELTAKAWELPPLGEAPDGIASCGRPRAGRLSSRGGSSSSGRSTTSCPGTPLTVGRAAAYHQTVPSERQENGISVHFCVVDQVVNTITRMTLTIPAYEPSSALSSRWNSICNHPLGQVGTSGASLYRKETSADSTSSEVAQNSIPPPGTHPCSFYLKKKKSKILLFCPLLLRTDECSVPTFQASQTNDLRSRSRDYSVPTDPEMTTADALGLLFKMLSREG